LKLVNPRGYQGGQGWLWWALTLWIINSSEGEERLEHFLGRLLRMKSEEVVFDVSIVKELFDGHFKRRLHVPDTAARDRIDTQAGIETIGPFAARNRRLIGLLQFQPTPHESPEETR
jgi:hypothetical protein